MTCQGQQQQRDEIMAIVRAIRSVRMTCASQRQRERSVSENPRTDTPTGCSQHRQSRRASVGQRSSRSVPSTNCRIHWKRARTTVLLTCTTLVLSVSDGLSRSFVCFSLRCRSLQCPSPADQLGRVAFIKTKYRTGRLRHRLLICHRLHKSLSDLHQSIGRWTLLSPTAAS